MTLLGQAVPLVLAGAVIVAAVVSLRRGEWPRWDRPSPFVRATRRLLPPTPRPGQIVELERIVEVAGWDAMRVHAQLRPIVREIAAAASGASPGAARRGRRRRGRAARRTGLGPGPAGSASADAAARARPAI